MILAILFDVDGTLVDSNDLHTGAWVEAFAHFGHILAFDEVRQQIGKGGDNLIPTLLPDLEQGRRQELERFRSELFARDYLPRVTPFPGVRPLFERLYADNIAIVLATSAKKAELEFNLGLIGTADLITAATSRDDVEHSKPCPELFEAALAAAGLSNPDETLVVGDTPWDVKAATRARLKTVAVRCGGFDEDTLREAGAARIEDGPESLLAHYPEWLGA